MKKKILIFLLIILFAWRAEVAKTLGCWRSRIFSPHVVRGNVVSGALARSLETPDGKTISVGMSKIVTRHPPTEAPTNLFSRQTNKLLPEPQASLLNGILWGEQKMMPKDFYEALRRTGTLHVIALSGMNITILVNLLAKVTLFLGRKRSILVSLIFIVGFIGFVGAPPSVVRAGIMGGLSLLAVYFGRKSWALLSLVLAAGIMLIVNPAWLANIGFQLSFLATLGIIVFGGKAGREKGVIGEMKYQLKTDLQTTLAAQVFTLPVILYNFKQLSLIAPVTNVLVLWIVQPIMVLGFGLSVMCLVFYPLAYPLAWIIWVPLTYFIKVVELTAQIPVAAINF